MATNISETYSLCSGKPSNDLLEKAALWEALCLVRLDSQWLLPFFWSKETNEPSAFAYSLALGYKFFGGSEGLRRALGSTTLFLTANALRRLQEMGGHPVGERTLFVLMRLANGNAYEDVLQDEKGNEVSILHEQKRYISSQERRQAIDRAKQRVRRSKNLLREIEINVKHLNPEFKAFRRLLQEADRASNTAA